MRNSLRMLLVGFALVGSIFALSGVAGAQDDHSDAYVSPNNVERNADLSGTSAAVSGVEVSKAAPAPALAMTGNDVMVLSVVGGVAVVAGAAILLARRRVAQA